MIDKSGQWWRGEDFRDLTEFLTEYTSRNYPAGQIAQSLPVWPLRGDRFRAPTRR